MRTILAAAALLLASTAAHANSPALQAIAIPPSACRLGNTLGIPARFGLGNWQLNTNGRTTIICPIPVRAPEVTSFRILYRDPDGRIGNASVKAFVSIVRPTDPASADMPCLWRSNFDGPAVGTGWVLATVTCPPPPVGSYVAELGVELWRRGPAGPLFYVGFAGIDFP